MIALFGWCFVGYLIIAAILTAALLTHDRSFAKNDVVCAALVGFGWPAVIAFAFYGD